MVRRLLPAALLFALAIPLQSCDDDTTGPVIQPTLDNLWPSDDGTEWRYAWRRIALAPDSPVLYPAPEDVPAVPSLDDARALLAAPDGLAGSSAVDYLELAFAGLDTTASGATGQKLREVLYLPDLPASRRELDPTGRLLHRLAAGGLDPMPDPAVLPATHPSSPPADAADAIIVLTGPTFLHGGVFEKTDDHIGTYGDLDRDLAWTFLEADLSVGHEWSRQIAPTLVPDAWLHARVQRRLDLSLAGRTYRGCLECLYLVDHGLREVQGPGPTVEGYYRLFDVGTVVYAPGVGPVHSEERTGIDVSLEAPLGWQHAELSLLPGDVSAAGPPSPRPNLETIWPGADGNVWDYASQATLYELTPEPDPLPGDDPPPLPTMSQLRAWLDQEPPGSAELLGEARIYMRLELDGAITTGSGVVAQNLVEMVRHPLEMKLETRRAGHADALRRLLWRARPDLRDAIAAQGGDPSSAGGKAGEVTSADAQPFFLFGCAWEKTDEHIGAHGDQDRELVWKWLEADLSVGEGFSLQLVPDLASDVWLHARVWDRLDWRTEGRTFRSCLEVLYVLDLGVQVAVDEDGHELGRFRSYGVCTIVYAPGTGPVHGHEKMLLAGDSVLQFGGNWIEERTVDLVGAEVAP